MSVGKFMQTAANRDYSKFWQQEGSFPWIMQQPKPPITGRPITSKENWVRCITGDKPYWMPAYFFENNIVWPDAMEEHPVPEVNGYDWWGVDWFMEPNINGMITKPGTRVINDFANWKNEVEWPDLSVVDFETDGKKIAANLDPDRYHVYECVEGLFERLHEMMPFDETLAAFYEEPEELADFFKKMCDYKIESTEKILKYYGRVDGVLYHDDWGHQKSGFFSNEMFREQIMPETKRFFDFLKEKGLYIELHSCGKNVQYVPEMIEMGIDMWTPQFVINDPEFLHKTYGKQMSFTFAIEIPHDAGEAEIRKMVRDFVDKYGENGRVMCWLLTDMTNPKQDEWGRDELYNYSLEYYNKLYGRS